MSLTGRLTAFFLAALAAVLVSFSVALYLLAQAHLSARLDERAHAALDTLCAATELEPDGLEWDRMERTLFLARDGEEPLWAGFDARGNEIDGGPGHAAHLADFAGVDAADAGNPATGTPGTGTPATLGGREWRVFRRTMAHPSPLAVHRGPVPGQPRVPGLERYRTIDFVVAVPLAPLHQTLSVLAWALAGISGAILLLAALAGRWACSLALAPVTEMADAARRITADTAGERLPEPGARGELQDLAGAFNGLLGRLEESLERQRRFAGEASHQLRTPLTAMLGQLEVALRRDRPPEEYRQALAKAAGQAGRLRRIVEMLLFLARADAEARLPDLSPLDLAAWLPGHLAEAWGGHPRFAEIRAEPGGGPVAVLAQAALLGQALDNLLDNALKHDPRGPVAVRVGLEGGLARIEVEDRGEGIAPGEAGRVFEPFFRSPEARRRGLPGIGLGLAVTARIVSAFGGRIEVESRPGHGSRFTIRLPLAPAAGLEGEPTGTAQEAGDG